MGRALGQAFRRGLRSLDSIYNHISTLFSRLGVEVGPSSFLSVQSLYSMRVRRHIRLPRIVARLLSFRLDASTTLIWN